jgi:Sulfotransferase domain
MKETQIFGNPSTDPLQDILAEAKLQKITDFNSQDIFVAGYPKSGNTWMQYLLAALRFGIKSSLAPDSLVQDLVPDVHYKRLYRRYLTPTFFKSHHLPQPKFRRVIYLVRDGRDVMVSYFHHLNAIGGQPDYLQLVTTGEGLFPCRWHEHVEAWLANPHGAEMMTISYENLQNNTVAELQKICEFAGLECEQGMLELVARETTFEAMRAKEKKSGWENPVWPSDKAFFRRGKVGSFQDEMPKQVLEAFTKISMPTLQRLGYL